MGDDWQRTGNAIIEILSHDIIYIDTVTGYCGLGRAVAALGLNTTEDVAVDYVVSSLGSVSMDLITAIYYAVQGRIYLQTPPATHIVDVRRRQWPEGIRREVFPKLEGKALDQSAARCLQGEVPGILSIPRHHQPKPRRQGRKCSSFRSSKLCG